MAALAITGFFAEGRVVLLSDIHRVFAWFERQDRRSGKARAIVYLVCRLLLEKKQPPEGRRGHWTPRQTSGCGRPGPRTWRGSGAPAWRRHESRRPQRPVRARRDPVP